MFLLRIQLHLLFIATALILPALGETGDSLNSASWLSSAPNGLPFIQNYDAKDYNAFPQNWAIVQDPNGIIYVANGIGILMFDGVSWRRIPVPNNSPVFSLDVDHNNGRVYVGAAGDFGYLAADVQGELQYVSLLNTVQEKDRSFREVWHTFAADNKVYFIANEGTFLWSPREAKAKKIQYPFRSAHEVNGQLYFPLRDSGLMVPDGDDFRLVNNTEPLADAFICGIFPFDEDRLLIVTYYNGLLLFDGDSLQPFPLEEVATSYLKQHRIYQNGTALADGRFVFNTRSGGIVIIDRQGKMVKTISSEDGLQGNTVWATYQDREGGLWLALDNGLSRLAIASPLSFYNEYDGFKGRIHTIHRHQDRLYIGTRLGAFYHDEVANRFRQVAGLQTLCSQFLTVEDPENDRQRLLAAASDGVYEIFDNRSRNIRPSLNRDLYGLSLHQSRLDPRRIFAGATRGLIVLSLQNGKWVDEGKYPEIRGSIRSIFEFKAGELWLGAGYSGMRLKYNFYTLPGKLYDIEKFTINGDPVSEEAMLRQVDGSPYLVAMSGLYRFRESTSAFYVDSTYQFVSRKVAKVFEDYVFQEDKQGRIWINMGGESAIISPSISEEGDTIKVTKKPFLPIADYSVGTIYSDTNGIVWFGGADGLIRYDPDIHKNYQRDFTVSIRRILVNNDSLLAGDSGISDSGGEQKIQLNYADNTIRFSYAAHSYQMPEKNRYQVFLDGFDAGWSDWHNESQTDYTNLPEGNYTFRVRAKNVYEHISEAAVFQFNILSPWYRTWWAYSLAIFLLTLGITAIVRYRERALRHRSKHLETVIAQRTREVRQQRDQLETQAEKLQEMDKLKTRFFANISHEFRTPLALVLGSLEQISEKIKPVELQQKLNTVYRNASRLNQLINQLLDISRLDAKKLPLQVAPGNIVQFINRLVLGFSSWGEQKNISLQFIANETPNNIYFDRDIVEKIINNLLSNALKFTPEGGKISVQLSVDGYQLSVGNDQLAINNSQSRDDKLITDNRSLTTDNWLIITVKDTGIGIPAELLPHIFDRFYQVDYTSTRAYEGTGIGLALTKELVERHYGSITVESEEAEGSKFTVRLPLGSACFAADEIVAENSASQNGSTHKPVMVPQISNHQTLNHTPETNSATTTEKSERGRSKSQIILIVEDQNEFRTYIRECLLNRSDHPEKYRILEAQNGREGLDMAIEQMPDLVISDVMMPKMNGYQLCEALKIDERTSHIPIILLTARAGQEDKLTGLKTGADDYLSKPFDSRELLVRVSNLIEQRQKLQRRFQQQMVLKPSEITVNSMDESFLKKAMLIVEAHIDDEHFQVETFQKEIGLSRSNLHAKLKALTGQSASEFIRTMRLHRAAELIKQNAGTIAEITYQVGFGSQSYFTRCFQKQFGMTPKAFQRNGQLEQ